MINTSLPVGAGVSFKAQHGAEALATNEAALWFEVHTENYFIDGGPRLRQLEQLRHHAALSLHGVAGSLGGFEATPVEHLEQVKRLVERLQPAQVSEHAVWSRFGGHYFADLLPLPRTSEALNQLCTGVQRYQDAIGRSILIENPTNYLPLSTEMDEPDFLAEICRRTGCGLLLDINNVYLSERNCGVDARCYVEQLDSSLIGEIHIAGFDIDPKFGEALLIDSHAAEVSEPVWSLLDFTLDTHGVKPVLLERDGNIPAFSELLVERRRAQAVIDRFESEQNCA